MNSYSISALVAMLLFFLGAIALTIGIKTYRDNVWSVRRLYLLFVSLIHPDNGVHCILFALLPLV